LKEGTGTAVTVGKKARRILFAPAEQETYILRLL
jgi:hypothetical protein